MDLQKFCKEYHALLKTTEDFHIYTGPRKRLENDTLGPSD